MSEVVSNSTGASPVSNGPTPQPTLWMVILGSVFGGLTLLFLMLLVLIDVIFKRRLSRPARFLVISIIAFGLALSGGFLGSSGQLSGSLPLPQILQNPLTFGVTGGAAVFLVSWIIGFWLYVGPKPKKQLPGDELGEVSVEYDEGTTLADAIEVAAKKDQRGESSVVFEPDKKPFLEPVVAGGQLTGKDAEDIINKLQDHLAQGSKSIRYRVTKPKDQNRITVTEEKS